MAKKKFNLKKRLSPQFTVKSSRTPESRIDIFNAIGCPNDNDFPTVVQTIHESQEVGWGRRFSMAGRGRAENSVGVG